MYSWICVAWYLAGCILIAGSLGLVRPNPASRVQAGLQEGGDNQSSPSSSQAWQENKRHQRSSPGAEIHQKPSKTPKTIEIPVKIIEFRGWNSPKTIKTPIFPEAFVYSKTMYFISFLNHHPKSCTTGGDFTSTVGLSDHLLESCNILYSQRLTPSAIPILVRRRFWRDLCRSKAH